MNRPQLSADNRPEGKNGDGPESALQSLTKRDCLIAERIWGGASYSDLCEEFGGSRQSWWLVCKGRRRPQIAELVHDLQARELVRLRYAVRQGLSESVAEIRRTIADEELGPSVKLRAIETLCDRFAVADLGDGGQSAEERAQGADLTIEAVVLGLANKQDEQPQPPRLIGREYPPSEANEDGQA